MERNDKGQFTSSFDLTSEYEEFFADYGGWVTASVDTQTTIDRLKAGVKAWLYWCQENGVAPLDADEDSVNAYIRWMIREDFADTTITRRFASVSKYYHFVSTDPRVDADIGNPTADISLPRDHNIKNTSEYYRVLDREGRKDIVAPSFDQLKPIFDHVPGEKEFTQTRNELICRLLWQTAVRSVELSRIRMDNITWDDRDIELRSAKLNRDDHPDLYYRHVWWEPNLDYLMRRWESKRAEVDPNEESPYLFIGEQGGQLEPSTISGFVKEAAFNADIQEPLVRDTNGSVQQWLYTAHRLRHSRITHLANETDLDLNYLRMMAGHAKVETTLTYVETDWETARSSYFDAV
jgi:integrase/recombinase XerD